MVRYVKEQSNRTTSVWNNTVVISGCTVNSTENCKPLLPNPKLQHVLMVSGDYVLRRNEHENKFTNHITAILVKIFHTECTLLAGPTHHY